MMNEIVFPDGFLWGASTSAHQIEGDNVHSDWWAFEQSGRAPRSGRAADSWNRWREDIDLAAQLGLGVFRISAEWSRIEPEPGVYDEAAIRHYAEVLFEARRRGMQTMLVLWHFTNPAWLTEAGGWALKGTPDQFAAYAALLAEKLGDHVDFWVTLNEADTYIWKGYITGAWPPSRKDAWISAYASYRGLASGHRRARAAIKDALGPEVQVGLTHLFVWPHRAQKGGSLSSLNVAYWNFLANDLFLHFVGDELDWLGVQYYHDSPSRFLSIANDDGSPPCTDMGWRIEPRGLYEVVMRAWRRLRKPIIVTENGLADATDCQRSRFIIDHLAWLHRAIEHGADVRGYLHWSLIDNFEWMHGFEPRFGLAEVDYETYERSLRPSALTYARIVRANGIAAGSGEGMTYVDGTGSLAPGD